MKQYEIVGNCQPAWNMTESTLCKLLGRRLTLGAAKKFADQMMREDMEGIGQFVSVDVDDGSFGVLYTATPATVAATPLRNSERRPLHPMYG